MKSCEDVTKNSSKSSSDFLTSSEGRSDMVNVNLTGLLNPSESVTCQCLIILNSELNEKLLGILEPKCSAIVLADGASNRVFQSQFKNSSKIKSIIGDLDSSKQSILDFYRNKPTVKIIHDSDQNTTDFEKSLIHGVSLGYSNFICLGAFGGRLDHTISAMHNAEKFLKNRPNCHLLLAGQSSLMVCLHPKRNYTVQVKSPMIERNGCGIITFSKVDVCETTGFRWNMGKKEYFKGMEWGQFISTSNYIQADQVTIQSTQRVFFEFELGSQAQESKGAKL